MRNASLFGAERLQMTDSIRDRAAGVSAPEWQGPWGCSVGALWHPTKGDVSIKPRDYRARREWQIAARARGEVPECGREACRNPVGRRPFVGSGTGVPLLYCSSCARWINEANGVEICTPEVPNV